MTCFHPIDVNKRGFVDLRVTVACGRCIGCRIDRARDWQVRLLHETQFHTSSLFVTLTYDSEHLPESGSLEPRDVQLFIKRLRKARTGERIRYFVCGEYGDELSRPHYHLIIYGVSFPDKRKHTVKDDQILYASDELERLWGKGFASFGNASADSCRYVADYLFKKVLGDRAKDHYTRVNPVTGELVELCPEFARMSRRPGIGSDFYERFRSDLFPSDTVIVKGQERPVPRAYTAKLKKDDEQLHDEIKAKRVNRAKSRRADNTPERLAVREEVARAKQGMRKRS